ncbi:MAG: winged helix-turn-helix domain-containing protein [Myxococcota bacterium]
MFLIYLFAMAEQWTFLTNHTHVLLCIHRDSNARLRDIAELVGITERATHRIICELKEAGYLEVVKEGRRNHYELKGGLPLRHPLENNHSAMELLEMLTNEHSSKARSA